MEEKLQARLVDTSEERARVDAAAAVRELVITFDGERERRPRVEIHADATTGVGGIRGKAPWRFSR